MPEYGSGGGYTVVMAGPFANSGGGTGKLTTISAPVENWKGGTSPYSQVIAMDDISVNSKIDIQLSADQIELFRGLDIAFTVENRGGEVTLVAVGDKPSADCVFQATASEMLIVDNIDGTVILGNTVKTTSFQKTGGDMSKPINMNSQNLYGLNKPMTDDAAANKSYVDASKKEANAYTDASKKEANAYTDASKKEANAYTNEQVKKAALPNLLRNPYFRNPVNQRGQTVYSFDSGYTIDGWRLHWSGDGSIAIYDGYISLYRPTYSAYLFQNLPLELGLIGKTVTVAAKVRGTGAVGFCFGGGSFREKNDIYDSDWTILTKTIQVPVYSYDNTILNGVEFESFSNKNFDIEWAGLFPGEHTAETIREYMWADKTIELLKCMRYFQKTDRLYQAVVSSNGVIPGTKFIVPMRIAPTVTVYDAYGVKDHVSVWTSDGISSVAVNQVPVNETGIYYIDADVPAGAICCYSYEASAEL